MLSRSFDQARYQFGHRAMAAAFGLGTAAWHRVLQPGFERPPTGQIQALRRGFERLIAEDFANADAGLYPRELIMELRWFELLRVLPEALFDVPQMLKRARREAHQIEAADDRYPAYYRRTFHWQVDGWLSAHSARIYELQVEVLFLGTMDVMRRMALVPLVRGLRTAKAPRILDVACGTGRFLAQLMQALPGCDAYGVDLSPHYVQKAQATCAAVPGVSFLVGNAEALPLAGETFDAVTCSFLFHELPTDARHAALREAHRVLKPGGLFVFEDAAQVGDSNSADLSFYFDWFPRAYHEPYYKSYRKEPIEALCEKVGLEVVSSEPKLFSKLVVARKPG